MWFVYFFCFSFITARLAYCNENILNNWKSSGNTALVEVKDVPQEMCESADQFTVNALASKKTWKKLQNASLLKIQEKAGSETNLANECRDPKELLKHLINAKQSSTCLNVAECPWTSVCQRSGFWIKKCSNNSNSSKRRRRATPRIKRLCCYLLEKSGDFSDIKVNGKEDVQEWNSVRDIESSTEEANFHTWNNANMCFVYNFNQTAKLGTCAIYEDTAKKEPSCSTYNGKHNDARKNEFKFSFKTFFASNHTLAQCTGH